MAEKSHTLYICTKCDAQSSKWNGRCFECGAWGTLQKQTFDRKDIEKKEISESEPANVINLGQIQNNDVKRISTKINEVDRVLGKGIVPGSLILWSGEPGIGKSTILTQVSDSIGKSDDSNVIYVSGEESANQVKGRFDRLNCDLSNIDFIGETNTNKIISAILKNKPKLVVIDSIQTIYLPDIPSEAGSINQIRANTIKFLELAKENDIAIILVGHITKDGQVAGPKSLEHIVDTVIYLESGKNNDYRMLRSTKNRFGSVNEIGIFEMTGNGFVEVVNPSLLFIESNKNKISGSVISCVMEGTRPFMVEIQSLVTKTVFGYPQRKASGYDLNRLQVLVAVLNKRAGINLTNQDVILNVVGGLKVNEPSQDLAVCFAIASSLLNQNVDRKIIALGEIGLGGEIRNINKIKERLNEAAKLGFTKALIPDVSIKSSKLELIKVKSVNDIVSYLRE